MLLPTLVIKKKTMHHFLRNLSYSIIVICLLSQVGNAQNNESTELETTQQNEGWPNNIKDLIAHLNTWDKDELDVHERPDEYPNLVCSGETNGWIVVHKEQLKELGAEVIWDSKNKIYILKKTEE